MIKANLFLYPSWGRDLVGTAIVITSNGKAKNWVLYDPDDNLSFEDFEKFEDNGYTDLSDSKEISHDLYDVSTFDEAKEMLKNAGYSLEAEYLYEDDSLTKVYHPCTKCKYYATCGDEYKSEICKGREEFK